LTNGNLIYRELKQLPRELHLLCPRQNDDDYGRYEEDVSQAGEDIKADADTVIKIAEAKTRRQKFVSSLQLLAFDGPESEQYQRYIWERLDEAMGKCDLCIREYYIAKLGLLAELREEYEEDEIVVFFNIINRRDTQRIADGLRSATAKLRSLPEPKRTLKGLDPSIIFPIFEALSCEAFLKDDALLLQHFDEPFMLIQSRNPLKTRDYMPAATRFLFESRKSRFDWAAYTWSHFLRPPTDIEWGWTIKETLQGQLRESSTPIATCRLWVALTFIVKQLDDKQITHSLFDLQPNICTTALTHLSRKDQGLRFILQAMKIILEKAPEAFWGAMGSISSSTIIEQIFESPDFEKHLQDVSRKVDSASSGSDDMLSWISPFLASLRPANRPPACRTLTMQLFKRSQKEDLSVGARYRCHESALEILVQTLRSFTDDSQTRQSVARVVLSDTLDTVSQHIDQILAPVPVEVNQEDREQSRAQSLDVVRNSLALETQCLKADFEMLSKDQKLQHGSSSYSPDIWNAVLDAFTEDDVKLSSAALLGTLSLPGLEPFLSRDPNELAAEKRQFNFIFEKMTGLFGQMLERISEFPPEHLDELFKLQETSMPLVSALFSADINTYQAAVELVKNISCVSGRKEAMAHLLGAYLGTTVFGLSWTFRRIANMKTFGSVPRMMKTGMEILDVLCDTQTGVLRIRRLNIQDSREYHAISSYWLYEWQALKTVFKQTEKWSFQVHDKRLMSDVCRDAMQYAEALFEQYDVFASALITAKPDHADRIPKTLLESADGSPGATLDAMIRWLRLRDEYLVDTLVKLVTKLLRRLGGHGMLVATEALIYMEEIATKSTIKTMLSGPQKAELVRALEAYHKKPLDMPSHKKQSTLREWVDASPSDRAATSTPTSSRAHSVDDLGDADIADSDLYGLSGKAAQTARASLATREQESKKLPLSKSLPSKAVKAIAKKKDDVSAFLETRRRERAAAEARRREAGAMLKGTSAIGMLTKGQGSGLNGLGVKGKDHSVTENHLMVSSESESESEDELDKQLFGPRPKPLANTDSGLFKGMMKSDARGPKAGPVKKVKQIRSQKDMRARLAPDLSELHKTILSWDFFADEEFPPSSAKDDYTLVSNSFKTVFDYQKTFQPLLILEGWQSFRSAKEDGNFKPFEVKVSNRLTVDNFVEISTTMTIADSKELGIGAADVILLSKCKMPESEPNQPHCLARVKEIGRKKGQVEIVYRVNSTNNTLLPTLAPGSPLWGIQILSLTPLEREYGALMALPYYDLCEEIIKAKPSPLLEYTGEELDPFIQTYGVNSAQANAVKSALDNDAFTLIQGPPGSGKTKTICALVGAMMTGSSNGKSTIVSGASEAKRARSALPPARKKVLVCAPSNAAVDELVMRFKSGVKMMNGTTEYLSVVRLGRSDAINANVKDVTLEELVSKRLNLSAPKESSERDINDIMMEHKAISDEVYASRLRFDECRSQGQPVKPEQEIQFDALKRKKAQLSLQIDSARDRAKTATRDAELNRKRMQQEILDSANVLCATLSGSGHEIFQGVNIEFDIVIIDEAAQSIELSALIPLKYGCSKCILVGDPKQLPPTVLSREAARFQYEQSLFARMEKNHQKDIHLLDTQYRMHPEISMFPSKAFYENRLKDGIGLAKLRFRPWHHSALFSPYRFFDVEGMHQNAAKGHSLVNIAELNVAMQLYDRLTTDCKKYDFSGKVGIITPYKGQLKELKARFSQRYGQAILSTVEFNTTDAFQGRESEIIIFSCVRASTKGIGFLNDVRRMNVGLTRAKCSLWVLGNSQSLVQGEFWRGLVEDAKERNLYTDGDVLSLLRRPLLTEDMMKDDVEMLDLDSNDVVVTAYRRLSATLPSPSESPSPRTSISQSPSVDAKPKSTPRGPTPVQRSTTAIPSRPSNSVSRGSSSTSITAITPRGDNAPEAQRKHSELKAKEGMYGPSGGKTGLNPHAMCNICGSEGHFSHNCDNIAARAASLGTCNRCKLPGHTQRNCPALRCLECGEIGHLGENCQLDPNRRLSAQEKERVKVQEREFGREKDRARERLAAKQLGEHAATVPVVKSSLQSTGFSGNARRGSGASIPVAEGKRKREEAPPDAPRGPKAQKTSEGLATSINGQPSSGALKPRPQTHERPSAASGASRSTVLDPGRTGNAVKPGLGRPPMGATVVKKKRPTDDDMFMKKK
jgi:senataxin